MSEADLKASEKEFKKTAYGKRIYTINIGVLISSIAFVVVMALNNISGEDGIFSFIEEGIFWLGLLIGLVSETIVGFWWNRELKEYIESKKD